MTIGVKCTKCGLEEELTNEVLKKMYELAGSDLSQVELMATFNGLKRRTCKDNKFHLFMLTDKTNDEIITVVNEYKIGNKSRQEIEPEIVKDDEEIARLEHELSEYRAHRADLEEQRAKISKKISDLEAKNEEITGTKNVMLWS